MDGEESCLKSDLSGFLETIDEKIVVFSFAVNIDDVDAKGSLIGGEIFIEGDIYGFGVVA